MTDLSNIPLRTIDGGETTLGDFAGKVALVVNVASKCGLTPQYQALEQEYARLKDQGFVVLGFPCNQFRGQEPGDEAEISAFCATTYGVSFPMFSKIEVNGDNRHPLYAALLRDAPTMTETEGGGMRARLAGYSIPIGEGDIMWNFEKFLVDREGRVVGHFAPDIAVDDPRLAGAIRTALAA